MQDGTRRMTATIDRRGGLGADPGPSSHAERGSSTAGGVAALVAAATYLVGFAMLATALQPLAVEPAAPRRVVAFLAANASLVHVWDLIIYVVNGVALVVLVLALDVRLRTAQRPSRVATAFGLIWAGLVIASGMLIINDLGVVVALHATDPQQAAATWTVLHAVEEGLGGGVELPGGLWALLVSWAGMRAGVLPRALGWLGVAAGAAGVATVLPRADALEAVFGLGLLVWFAGMGAVLLRRPRLR